MDVAAYVEAFNEAEGTGDLDRFVEHFCDDAVMEFRRPSDQLISRLVISFG